MFTGIGGVAEGFATKQSKEMKDKTYFCEVCPATFNRKYNRDRHMELIHKVPRPVLPPLFPEKSVPKNTAKNPEDGIIHDMPDPPITVLIDDKHSAMGYKRDNSDTNHLQIRKIKKAKRGLTMDEDFENQREIDEDPPSVAEPSRSEEFGRPQDGRR